MQLQKIQRIQWIQWNRHLATPAFEDTRLGMYNLEEVGQKGSEQGILCAPQPGLGKSLEPWTHEVVAQREAVLSQSGKCAVAHAKYSANV